MPVFLITALAFALILKLSKGKTTNAAEKKSDDFWRRENESNFVRKKDISGLSYIKVSEAELPFEENLPHDSEMYDVEKRIKKLFDRPVLNLSGMSNTDIKIEYGTANFSVLSEADTNFLSLIRDLDKWGRLLEKEDRTADAKKVFEYSVSIGSDIGSTLKALGSIYRTEGNREGIRSLIKLAEESESPTMKSVITYLNNL